MDQDGYTRVIETFGHNGRVGVLVEFRVRDEFSTRCQEFVALARDIAVHIATENPASVEELMQQRFVKDQTHSIRYLIAAASNVLGEHISVTRFIRWDNEMKVEDGHEPPPAVAAAMGRGA